MSAESSKVSGEEGFLPTTSAKTSMMTIRGAYSFQVSFDDSHRLKAACRIKKNKNGNVHYYFEVEFNFWND